MKSGPSKKSRSRAKSVSEKTIKKALYIVLVLMLLAIIVAVGVFIVSNYLKQLEAEKKHEEMVNNLNQKSLNLKVAYSKLLVDETTQNYYQNKCSRLSAKWVSYSCGPSFAIIIKHSRHDSVAKDVRKIFENISSTSKQISEQKNNIVMLHDGLDTYEVSSFSVLKSGSDQGCGVNILTFSTVKAADIAGRISVGEDDLPVTAIRAGCSEVSDRDLTGLLEE